MNTYKYQGPPQVARPIGPLPEGEYDFEVTDCQEPYESKAGNWVLPLKLAILPSRVPVFSNPWTGTTKQGEFRDNIAEFLLSVSRTPAIGQEPDWPKVIGARGRCRLSVEIAEQGSLKGQPVNRTAWFHVKRETVVGHELDKYKQRAEIIQPKGQVEEVEPDDIPF